MRDVYVIGIGITKFGEIWDKSFRTLFVEAAQKAIENADVNGIDSMYVGAMTPGLFVGQEHIGCLLADYLGVAPIPATRVESACASGGAAMRQAFIEVGSGLSDVVLAGGVEKMNDGADVTYSLATAADAEYESYHGVTFPGLYALLARAHMHKHGTTREQLAMVAVKNHKHGAKNPVAQFPFEITIDAVLNSTAVAEPLNLLDCSPVTDGAAAVILASEEVAKKHTGHPMVKVRASAQATSAIALHSRKDISRLEVVADAAKKAYEMAELTPADVDLAEVHDCFTIAEIIVIEELGFAETGKGGTFVEAGEATFGGKTPVNLSGGLKAKGHPIGATGIAQIYDLTRQLRGEAGESQLDNARIGLAQNMGGSGGSSVIHILERV